jgi:carbonic anhydrase/acetyltransferase-like protein (isoleucine patch superfamily)
VIVLPYLDHLPRIDPRVTADRWAAVIGRAEIAPDCYLGPLATLRADGEQIQVGSDCWFGEAATMHIADSVYPARTGSHVTVGRYGLVHACSVADGCVIGEHAVVMDGAQVGADAVIAADSVVPPGKALEGGWLYAGAPARPVERIPRARLEALHRALRSTAARGEEVSSADAKILRAARPVDPLRLTPGLGVEDFSAEGAYIAPSASIAGRLQLAPHSSIWFAVEIDAPGALVELGEGANIQDNSRLHLAAGERIRIGRRVTVGHNVRMSACEIEDEAIIGMGSIIGKGTVVRAGACVAAGAITQPGTEVKAGYIWSGRPAREARGLSPENREWFALGVDVYIAYARNYLAAKPTLAD